jgi:hypothetical protein
MRVQRRVAEGQDRLRHITARRRNGNVVVLLKVDAGVLLARVVGSAKEIPLETRVSGARNVLAVNPATLPAATTTANRGTTATAGGTTVRVAVEATALTTAPARLRGRGLVTACPVATASIEIVVTISS